MDWYEKALQQVDMQIARVKKEWEGHAAPGALRAAYQEYRVLLMERERLVAWKEKRKIECVV